MSEEVQRALRGFMVNTWLSGDARNFGDDTDLLALGVLDSFALLALLGFILERFGLSIDPADVHGETFTSVRTIAALISRQQTAGGPP